MTIYISMKVLSLAAVAYCYSYMLLNTNPKRIRGAIAFAKESTTSVKIVVLSEI